MNDCKESIHLYIGLLNLELTFMPIVYTTYYVIRNIQMKSLLLNEHKNVMM